MPWPYLAALLFPYGNGIPNDKPPYSEYQDGPHTSYKPLSKAEKYPQPAKQSRSPQYALCLT